MRLWHAELIPKLCQKHLCAMWREGLGAYKIITENRKGYRNHPATIEFKHAPNTLYLILELVREEMIKRNYHPKEMPPRHVSKATEHIQVWQTLEEQIKILKLKGCKCNI